MTEKSFTTVGDLRRLLVDPSIPDDRPVVLPSDAEGNNFHYLADFSDQMFDGEEQVYPVPDPDRADLADEHEPGVYDEDEAPDDAVRVLVLWPR